MTSKIEKIEGDSVVLRLSRAVDAKILALLGKMLEAVDSEKDDYIIPPIGEKSPNVVPQPAQPWPTIPAPTPYPPGIVVCYGCGPAIYGPTEWNGYTVTTSSSLTVKPDNEK